MKNAENPFAVVIITPIMQRAHELPFSKDIAFVDSTSSCDAQGHSVTFMLTACGIGAVPLAIMITKNQSIADYAAAFNLIKTSISNGFGNQGFPLQFITDDSDAERQALKSVFPDSKLLLCRFHVLQSVWRWLWEMNHQIHKDDRKTLYLLFRAISEASTHELAMDSFNSAIGLTSTSSYVINGNNIPLKYPKWIQYVSKYWDRKEIWCMAFRNASTHGHHTNNFSEVNGRLFKDIVLSRNKAYNVVALVDFVCTSMEEYYQKRLRNFVNGRNDTARYLYEDELNKASHIHKEDIEELSDHIFKIKSENHNLYYEVDGSVGFCTCPKGKMGGFCKHQASVYHHFGQAMPNLPPISVDARYSLAKLAFGQNVGPKSFYMPLIPELSNNQPLNQDINEELPTIQSSNEPVNINDIHLANVTHNEKIDEYENQIISLMTDNFKKYNRETSSAVLQKCIDRLKKVKSSRTWESFLSTAGNNISLRHRTRATIRVQPTTISRRKPGITRGSKRLPVGRPLKSDKQNKFKRKRNLGENVRLNVPNAKSHS